MRILLAVCQKRTLSAFLLAVLQSYSVSASELGAYPEHLRPDPFGHVVEADRHSDGIELRSYAAGKTISLESARGGYVSFHLVVQSESPDKYLLNVRLSHNADALKVDLFREWFHFVDSEKRYYPDALIPVKLPYSSSLPEAENGIPGQTAQAFWVDIWIPLDATPGMRHGNATLRVNGKESRLDIQIRVLDAVIPESDTITIDHNSYGVNWIPAQYPKLVAGTANFYESDALYGLIQAYHRIFYEHRGTFHQLGYGHGGKVGPEFAPVLTGNGRSRHVASWDAYDRHYGPLLDGTAFNKTRRGQKPIPYVYLPINPEWPASFLYWGEKGYETEFANVVSEMERHFREKGWTSTRFEVFFNHKKRYKAFPWDGDEVRFPRDNQYFLEYSRILKKALPADTPVHFLMRADVSWSMERQFRELAGVVGLWVCSESILGWQPSAPEMLHKRGDVVWSYGGPPVVSEPSATIARSPFQAWLWGLDGFVHWQTVEPGPDPWYHFDGGGAALVYSGERFGLEEPIPSIRLKIQRNALQDLAVMERLKNRQGRGNLAAESTKRFDDSTVKEWWSRRPGYADKPSQDWSNDTMEQDQANKARKRRVVRSNAWANVHQYVMQILKERP